tara:strand:- start:778 stop:2361 length:1584 start_codon:yes stop_codon:yes gene_type:complete
MPEKKEIPDNFKEYFDELYKDHHDTWNLLDKIHACSINCTKSEAVKQSMEIINLWETELNNHFNQEEKMVVFPFIIKEMPELKNKISELLKDHEYITELILQLYTQKKNNLLVVHICESLKGHIKKEEKIFRLFESDPYYDGSYPIDEFGSGGKVPVNSPTQYSLFIDYNIETLEKKYASRFQKAVEIESENKREATIDWIKNEDVTLIIAFSGGKDSIAMVLYVLYELNIPKERIELWHHDVDGGGENLFDWECTPSYCRAFADALGLKILFSYAKGGILREMYRENETIQSVFFQKETDGEYFEIKPRGLPKDYNTRRKFPAVVADLKTRWCSGVAKISVMRKAINNWDRFDNANICILTGERRLESTARSKYDEVEIGVNSTKTRKVISWRPIIDWSETEVWDIFKKYKIQPHPCYELSWGRCSCQICIYSSPNTWAAINEISPEKVQRVVEIEKDLGNTLYHTKKEGSKNVYDMKVKNGFSKINEESKKRWLKEALGTFVSPIIVEEWKLPLGAFKGEQCGAS